MSTDSRFHTNSPNHRNDIFHTTESCSDGRRILPQDREVGTGNKRLCKECASGQGVLKPRPKANPMLENDGFSIGYMRSVDISHAKPKKEGGAPIEPKSQDPLPPEDFEN